MSMSPISSNLFCFHVIIEYVQKIVSRENAPQSCNSNAASGFHL
jgi:hypothetical protein